MHTAKTIASPRKARARVIQASIIVCLLEALAGSVWANPNLPTDVGFRSAGLRQVSGSAVPDARSVTVIAKRGDTLLALLHEQGLEVRYCARLLPVIGQQDTRPLHAGDRIELSLVTSGSFNLLRSMEIESRNAKPLKVDFPADLWQVTTNRREVSGIVGSNLGASLRRAGLPASLTDAVLSATKLDRDLASTLKSTSAFAIAFDEVRLGGRTVGSAHLLDISLTTSELEHRLYFFRDPEIGEALVDANGKGIAWLHLQRPVGRAIEATIRAYADPLFTAAGLDAGAIKVHLVQTDQINAFVAPGMNMFLFTGLLMRADTPNQVIGVIAHETGHIADGHLIRIQDELHNATIGDILAMLVCIGPGVATRNSGIGVGAATMG